MFSQTIQTVYMYTTSATKLLPGFHGDFRIRMCISNHSSLSSFRACNMQACRHNDIIQEIATVCMEHMQAM